MATDVTANSVDEILPPAKLFTLGLQHVLVMYAGAIAVPLIVGRVLNLTPEQVAFLISADLFVCGIVTVIQSLGMTKWFGIKLPVMMGVTFASVGPMVAIAQQNPGTEGARMLFGSVMAAGLIAMLLATTRIVWPSAGARATYSAATLPPAPGRFSTITGCLSLAVRFFASTRATWSAE